MAEDIYFGYPGEPVNIIPATLNFQVETALSQLNLRGKEYFIDLSPML
ncbi:MAG: hypothetical protein SWO11_10240 [Thermodesulfobacteriota bacterium]|nr:hypothetical protein [Thermodesulfobacteriota bacterium]